MKEFGYHDTGLDISYIGDLPGGAGMGSSSAFTAALILAIKTHQKNFITPYELSYLSYDIEKNKLKETVGIQDQIATSYGGFNKVIIDKAFMRVGMVAPNIPIKIDENNRFQ